MASGRRPYLVPDGDEVDCAYFLTKSEYVSGFLRLPRPSHTGRMRFLEDAPDLSRAQDKPLLEPVPVTLPDGKGGGTEGCLLNSFVSATRFSAPMQPQFPLALAVNQVIVGSSDPEQRYASAQLRCPELVRFFDGLDLTPERAIEIGSFGVARGGGETGGVALELREGVEIDGGNAPDVAMRWYGEIVLTGAQRPVEEWAEALVERLCLFAFLCDQPLRPGQIYAEADTGRVDFYASWPEAAAPSSNPPLFLLSETHDLLAKVLTGWDALLDGAHDLLDHLSEFQLFRESGTMIDQVLSLSRCLELYFDFSPRFDSKYRPTNEHREIVEEVIAALPQVLRDRHGEWVRDSLLNANQRRVVAQLEAILMDLGPEVIAACGVDDAAAFARRAKAARNHYTHPSGSVDKEVPEGRDLVIHINRLWFLIRACVLRELGFEDEEIVARLVRSGRRYLLE
jgi:hypothetical protein